MADPRSQPSSGAALAAAVERLVAAAAAMDALRGAIAAGDPWPLAERFGTEPEAHWGPREVLAHCAEMLPFWLGELERILAGAAEPVPFGRIQSDEIRIASIERDRSLPLRELFDRIDVDVARYRRRLAELGPADAARRGLHRTLGELTVEAALERLVVSHLEGHAEQLREALGTSA